MKVAAVTLVRDSARFIVPHLRMYKGVDRNVALFIPQALKGGASGHSTERDNSRELIERYCPGVEIRETRTDVWGAPLWNEAIELVSDCEKVVLLHADVVLSYPMWLFLYGTLITSDADVYRLDMTKCMINYYHDFDHGVRDCLDIEPIAVKTDVRFRKFYDYPDGKTTFTIDDPRFVAHHFTGWKGIFATKDWLEGRVPSESNVYIGDLEPKEGWISCPDEIRKKFDYEHEDSH